MLCSWEAVCGGGIVWGQDLPFKGMSPVTYFLQHPNSPCSYELMVCPTGGVQAFKT
jgi:hypothetical protein